MVHAPGGRDRRRFLALAATAGTASVAGCSGLWEQTGATDVVAYNAATEPKTVEVTITAADAERPHTSRTVSLAPSERADPVNRSKIPTNRSYAVEADVEAGPSETFDWDDPDVERAPLYVFVDDSRNVKFLLQAG